MFTFASSLLHLLLSLPLFSSFPFVAIIVLNKRVCVVIVALRMRLTARPDDLRVGPVVHIFFIIILNRVIQLDVISFLLVAFKYVMARADLLAPVLELIGADGENGEPKKVGVDTFIQYDHLGRRFSHDSAQGRFNVVSHSVDQISAVEEAADHGACSSVYVDCV